MADALTNGPKPAPKRPPGSGVRPDFATLAGIALALAGILGGLLMENGSIQDITQMTAALIVFGGTIGAVLVTTPVATFWRACQALGDVFLERGQPAAAIIESLIQYATKARKNGIVSLETDAAAIPDPFFRKSLNLAVDGADLQDIKQIMELDIALSEQASEAEARVWEAAGGYAPTIGIIGAVMGLIQVMKHLEDIKEVGHGIAVAFVATVYGVASANIFFLPVASKLKGRMRAATLRKDLMLEGVLSIVEGVNPTLIRVKLNAFDPEGKRTAPEPKDKTTAAAAERGGRARIADAT